MNDFPGPGPSRNSPRQTVETPRASLQPEAARSGPPASRHARKQWVVVGNLIMSLLLVGLVGGFLATVYARQAFVAPGPLPQEKAVFIPRGSGIDQIAETLERNNVISDRLLFVGAVHVLGRSNDLKWGEYLFPRNVSTAEALAIIIEGRSIEYRLTIPEGLTSEQIVGRLRDNEVLTGEIARVPREGSLLPETYRFTRGTTRQQMIDQMTQHQTRLLQQIWNRRAQDLPIRSAEELVILASIVEKETGRADERARVAGVFINRLNRRMRLQSDPTIVYGVVGGRGTLGRPISRADINQLTPFNTYQIDGLPPTPIANPGRAAMEAVANPARHRDLYFVADGTGGHAFAETLEQHNRNVAQWREIERNRASPEAVRDRTSADILPAAPAVPAARTTPAGRPTR